MQKQFSQLVFYDTTNEEIEGRDRILQDRLKTQIPRKLLDLIQNELDQKNCLYKQYKPIGREVLERDESVMVIVDDFRSLKLYCRPESEDFAGCIPANEPTGQTFSRDIIVQKQDSRFLRISESHPACHPLGYVLLHLTGQPG